MKAHCVMFLTVLAITLSLLGCRSPTPEPTPVPTETPMPPPTETPVPPTSTPAAILGSKDPLSVGDLRVRIAEVVWDETYYGGAPASMSEDDMVLGIELELLDGEFDQLVDLDLWITDENGSRIDSGVTLAVESSVVWLFPVPRTSKSFFLHFPSGEIVDLAPLLPR